MRGRVVRRWCRQREEGTRNGEGRRGVERGGGGGGGGEGAKAPGWDRDGVAARACAACTLLLSFAADARDVTVMRAYV